MEEMGRRAVEMFLAAREDPDMAPGEVVLAPLLEARESSHRPLR